MTSVQSVIRRRVDAMSAVGDALHRMHIVAAPIEKRARPVLAGVSGLGWLVLGLGAGCWLLGAELGWVEFLFAAAACLILFVLCAAMTLGRTTLNVTVEVTPPRVVAGQPAAGRVHLTNTGRARLLPLQLELPIGRSAARFDLPTIGRHESHEEIFVLPTSRRGVIPIGPATTVRGDPFGLLRRAVAWTGITELFVHPVTVPLEPIGSGLLRDLEGHTTDDVSMSDLAFHTLREYAPGDDRRYIHWRSTAKLSGSADDGTFLVRQFLDTRRSHVTVLVDGTADSYTETCDFELALSAAASVVVRAVTDEMDTTVMVGGRVGENLIRPAALDLFARAEVGTESLPALGARAAQSAPDTSIAVLVGGPATEFVDFLRGASHFSAQVNVIGIQIDTSRPAGISAVSGLTLLMLPELAALPAALGGTVR